LLWLRAEALHEALDSDTDDHECFEAEEADPDCVEDALLLAVDEEGLHILLEHRVGGVNEEKGFQDVNGVPGEPALFRDFRPGRRSLGDRVGYLDANEEANKDEGIDNEQLLKKGEVNTQDLGGGVRCGGHPLEYGRGHRSWSVPLYISDGQDKVGWNGVRDQLDRPA
jgi:hypothetical protein